MTASIVRVEPTDRQFAITWRLTVRCNYDCMYCPTTWHNNRKSEPALESLQQAWHNIVSQTQHLDMPYKISFTGGEVTTVRAFLPFVSWLRSNYESELGQILVTSNGSASLNYYRRLLELIDNLSLSTHSEHMDEQKFFHTVIGLKNSLPVGKHLHVNIMNEPWNQDRISQYQQMLTDNDISWSVNTVDITMATRAQPIFKGKLNLAL